MKTETLSQLISDPLQIGKLSPEEICPLLAHLASIQTALTAQLLSSSNVNGALSTISEDCLLTVDEAGRRLNCSKDWLYRNSIKASLHCTYREPA